MNLKAEQGNIVLTKGTVENFNIQLKGFNFTQKSDIGLYLRNADTEDFVDISTVGNENLNPYITASVTTKVGTAYSPMVGGTYDPITDKYIYSEQDQYWDHNTEKEVSPITVKLSSNTNTKTYPMQGIDFRIAINPYYIYKNGSGYSADAYADSYSKFKIYIANVEGTNIFIPGNGSKETNVPTNVTTADQPFTTGPANTSVKIRKNTSGIWIMSYNNNTYEFDETYKYWVKKN